MKAKLVNESLDSFLNEVLSYKLKPETEKMLKGAVLVENKDGRSLEYVFTHTFVPGLYTGIKFMFRYMQQKNSSDSIIMYYNNEKDTVQFNHYAHDNDLIPLNTLTIPNQIIEVFKKYFPKSKYTTNPENWKSDQKIISSLPGAGS